MKRVWGWYLLSVVVCVAAGCARRATDDAVESRRAALDFPTGEVRGTVRWKGVPISGLAAQGVVVAIDGIATTAVDATGAFSLPQILPGTHTLTVYQPPCEGHPPTDPIGEGVVTVSAGVMSTIDLSLTGSAAFVTATITSNGAPVPNPGVVLVTPLCSRAWAADAEGNIARFVAPGSYEARVFGSHTLLGEFSFDVTSGQDAILGPLDFAVGAVEGVISWNGAPVSGLAADGLAVVIPNVALKVTDGDGGHYLLENVVPGTYTLEIYSRGCANLPAEKIGETSITIAAGATTTVDVDLTSSAGLVTGSITSNGVPLFDPMITLEFACGSRTWATTASGGFAHFVAPGDHTAAVSATAPGWVAYLGSFAFSVAAGQVFSLGARDFPTGEVSGSIVWRGLPVSGLAAQGLTVVLSGARDSVSMNAGDGFRFPLVAPGPHTVDVYWANCTSVPGEKLGSFAVTVMAATTNTINPDITSTAGLVVGAITANGLPVLRPEVRLDPSCGNPSANEIGQFAHFVAPGSYDGHVFADDVFIGRLAFGVVAGLTTNVDVQATPVGKNVKVDVSGGLGTVNGLALEFTEVTVAGDTTVVETFVGPPPPTSFQVLGGRYWNIDTTAMHDGPITVCIRYDETELTVDEGELRLMHYAEGLGVMDITLSVDATADVVCGTTDSLSPFAIVEPLTGPNTPPVVTAPAEIVTDATRRDGALVTFPASAFDAEEPTLSPVCAPASGSLFPLGETVVTCTAIDAGGLSASASFPVRVRVGAATDGTFFLPPINADGSSTFKGGTIPVKFKLTGASAAIGDLVARLTVAKVSSAVTGSDLEATSNGPANDGNVFRYDAVARQYIYNLSAKSLSSGTWSLRVDLGDGAVHKVNVSLK